MNNKQELVKSLLDIGCFKFGQFTLKSGIVSPIYIDLRSLISHPSVLKQICEELWCLKQSFTVESDVICGVPYTALPIASVLSVSHNVPLVLKRKEAKTYGTKQLLEGAFKPGEKCLIIEDVVTSGSSVLETVNILRERGLIVSDCMVILDRQQGGEANLASSQVTMHSLFNLNDVIEYLSMANVISKASLENIKDFLTKNQIVKPNMPHKLPFIKRAEMSENSVFKKLCHIINDKNTNLCVAVDVTSSADLIEVTEKIGPHICMLKTHVDILEDFNFNIVQKLKSLSQQHNFLILEDRKFSDIGHTVLDQYQKGIYKIEEWADIVTVHSVPGEGVVQALKSTSDNKACVLIAQMSSQGCLITPEYTNSTIQMAEKHQDFVIGFISQSRISHQESFLHISPGVHLESSGDDLGQKYRTVEQAIVKDGVDVIIVGRGITASANVAQSAQCYKEEAFVAYKKLL